jgi:hypothetical protein
MIEEKREIELKTLLKRVFCMITNMGTFSFFPLAL